MFLRFVLFVSLFGLANATAWAGSVYTTGNNTISAAPQLDMRVTIPKLIFLQVGTGTYFADSTGVNLISFNVLASNLGNGTAVAGTVASGDLGNGSVTARLVGNNGSITLSATATGGLQNATGDTINYNQINTQSLSLTTPVVLAAPVLSNATSSTVIAPSAGRVVNKDARWTYTYLNSSVVPSGVYGGVNIRNGRVTYTASML